MSDVTIDLTITHNSPKAARFAAGVRGKRDDASVTGEMQFRGEGWNTGFSGSYNASTGEYEGKATLEIDLPSGR
jgi:hypothetical protein